MGSGLSLPLPWCPLGVAENPPGVRRQPHYSLLEKDFDMTSLTTLTSPPHPWQGVGLRARHPPPALQQTQADLSVNCLAAQFTLVGGAGGEEG